MYEVEIKVRADHGRVRSRLADRDATHVGAVIQEDTYYDAPDRDFAETDEALRLRRERASGDGPTDDLDALDGEAETVRLTYKGPLLEAESKSREEHETTVGSADEADAILSDLGFEPAATVRKERDRYRIDEYAITLDRVGGLGEFVEVETETEDEDIAAARDGARSLLEALELDPTEQIRTSYLGLLLEAEN